MINCFNPEVIQINKLMINRVIGILKMKYLKRDIVKFSIGFNFKYPVYQ
jgi:hypothetical protein